MKKIFSVLTICLCILLGACSEDYVPGGHLELVSTEDIYFSAAGGEGVIHVNAVGCLNATSDKEWCTATVDGNSIRVRALETQEISSRSALITITCGDESIEVPVVQAGAVIILEEYNLYYCCGYEGGQFVYDFKTNSSYAIEVSEDAADWLTYVYDTENNLLIFNVAESSDKSPRGAEVKLSSGTKEVVLSISQIEVSSTSFAGNWNMSYFSGAYEQAVSGTGQIGTVQGLGMVLLDVPQENFLPLEVGENGTLIIPSGIQIGTYASYVLRTAVSISGGYFSIEVPCVAVPKVKDGNLIYHFGYCSSYTDGVAVEYPMIYAFSGSSPAGYLEYYEDLEISRPLN